MSQEIQELRHQIRLLDRKRKALRAEALVLSLQKKKARLAADRRDRARKIDSEILTLNRRIDRIRQQRKPLIQLKKPLIKLPGKKAKPVPKAVPAPLARAKARAQAAQQSWPSVVPPVATFQPSAASADGGFPMQAPAMLPATQSGGEGGGSAFQPSSASFPEGAGEAAVAAAGESSGPGMGTILLILGVAAAGGGAIYYWRRKGMAPSKRAASTASAAATGATGTTGAAKGSFGRPAFTLPARTVIPTQGR